MRSTRTKVQQPQLPLKDLPVIDGTRTLTAAELEQSSGRRMTRTMSRQATSSSDDGMSSSQQLEPRRSARTKTKKVAEVASSESSSEAGGTSAVKEVEPQRITRTKAKKAVAEKHSDVEDASAVQKQIEPECKTHTEHGSRMSLSESSNAAGEMLCLNNQVKQQRKTRSITKQSEEERKSSEVGSDVEATADLHEEPNSAARNKKLSTGREVEQHEEGEPLQEQLEQNQVTRTNIEQPNMLESVIEKEYTTKAEPETGVSLDKRSLEDFQQTQSQIEIITSSGNEGETLPSPKKQNAASTPHAQQNGGTMVQKPTKALTAQVQIESDSDNLHDFTTPPEKPMRITRY